MEPDILSDIVRQLAERKGEWREIADGSGVPYDTLTKIAQGKTKNPRVDTVIAIDQFLRRPAVDTPAANNGHQEDAAA